MLIQILAEVQNGNEDANLDTIEELAIFIHRAVLIRKGESSEKIS